MYRINWPNRISIARVLLVGPFVTAMLYVQDHDWGKWARWMALAVFFLMAVTDWLDGFLARRLHQETIIGRFLDPLGDKLLMLCAMVLLAMPGTSIPGILLPPAVAVIAISKDLITVLGFTILYLVTSEAYIDARRTGKWCTALQLALIISVLVYPNLPAALHWLPRALWWAASIMALVTVVHYFQLGRRFLAAHEAKTRVQPAGKH